MLEEHAELFSLFEQFSHGLVILARRPKLVRDLLQLDELLVGSLVLVKVLFEGMCRDAEERWHCNAFDTVQNCKRASFATCEMSRAAHDVRVGEDESFFLRLDGGFVTQLLFGRLIEEVSVGKLAELVRFFVFFVEASDSRLKETTLFDGENGLKHIAELNASLTLPLADGFGELVEGSLLILVGHIFFVF